MSIGTRVDPVLGVEDYLVLVIFGNGLSGKLPSLSARPMATFVDEPPLALTVQ